MNFVNTKQPFASNTYILNSKGSKFPENNGIVIPWNVYIFSVVNIYRNSLQQFKSICAYKLHYYFQ